MSDAAAVRAAGAGLMATPATSADGGRCVPQHDCLGSEAGKDRLFPLHALGTNHFGSGPNHWIRFRHENQRSVVYRAFQPSTKSTYREESLLSARANCIQPELLVHRPDRADAF